MTVVGPFLAIFLPYVCLSFTFILKCLTGLNIDWFKSYGLRCILRPHASSANSQKTATDKWSFFPQLNVFFHKTEIQTVISRRWTSLNLNWYKSYDTKCKNTDFANVCFCTKSQKNGNGNICVLCHNFWNQLEFRPVKHLKMTVWTSVLWKMHIHMAKKARNGRKTVIYKGTFVSNQSLSK